MIKTLILTLVLVAAAVLLLGVKALFVKDGRFPSGHVHDLPALRRRGVTCAASHNVNEKKTK